MIIFEKLNGNIRVAHGTTNLSEVPNDQWPQGKRKPSDGVVTFYDTDKMEWRCLKEENLLGFEVVT